MGEGKGEARVLELRGAKAQGLIIKRETRMKAREVALDKQTGRYMDGRRGQRERERE